MSKTIPLDVLIRTYEAMKACALADHTDPTEVRSALIKAANAHMSFSMALQRIVGDQRIEVTE